MLFAHTASRPRHHARQGNSKSTARSSARSRRSSSCRSVNANGRVGNYNAHVVALPDSMVALSPECVRDSIEFIRPTHDRAARLQAVSSSHRPPANTVRSTSTATFGLHLPRYFREVRGLGRVVDDAHKVILSTSRTPTATSASRTPCCGLRRRAPAPLAARLSDRRCCQCRVALVHALRVDVARAGLSRLAVDVSAHRGRSRANWDVLAEPIQRMAGMRAHPY